MLSKQQKNPSYWEFSLLPRRVQRIFPEGDYSNNNVLERSNKLNFRKLFNFIPSGRYCVSKKLFTLWFVASKWTPKSKKRSITASNPCYRDQTNCCQEILNRPSNVRCPLLRVPELFTLWSVASTGTPDSRRRSTTATCPFRLAQWIGRGPCR